MSQFRAKASMTHILKTFMKLHHDPFMHYHKHYTCSFSKRLAHVTMTKTKTNPSLVCHFLMMFHLLSADRKKGSYLILTILLFNLLLLLTLILLFPRRNPKFLTLFKDHKEKISSQEVRSS
jgi:hypothetical protein